MITVPWVMDSWSTDPTLLTISDSVAIAKFRETFSGAGWVEFLFEHAADIEVVSYYDSATMLHNIDLRFLLPPEEETMYRLRFD